MNHDENSPEQQEKIEISFCKGMIFGGVLALTIFCLTLHLVGLL